MNVTGGVIESSASAADAPADVQYVPVPAWVRHGPAPAVPESTLEDFTGQGVLRILHDTQLSLIEPGVACHVRVLQRILTRAGAERAASLAIEFDPGHERIEIHTIRILRGEICIEHARPGAMQLLRRESQLERLALNGRLTASFLVPGLREGDQLEISFTHFSALPVLSGRYGGWLIFNSYAPWAETRLRLVRPLSRRIALKPFNDPPAATASVHGAHEVLQWSLAGQKRLVVEDLMPPWTVKNPCYQATEFSTWGEVAQLFAPYYQDAALPADMSAVRDRLTLARADPETLAVEWLRFVQRELRYFALSFGDGGLLPRDLETIWGRRFGDCKDAARLYVAGARSLGLDACAALVSTTHGMSLKDFLPSAHVFNHVVVRLRIGENTHWLDPTLPSQAGSLRQLMTSHAGWALPLSTDTEALEALPEAVPIRLVHCEDRITLGPRADSPAKLARRMALGYWAADNVRHRIANDGVSKLALQLQQELLATWPRSVEILSPAFEEDTGTNQLIMRCAYEIREPWTRAENGRRHSLSLVDTVTNKELPKLQIARRQSPILLGRPRRVSWRATIEMPRRWWGKGWRKVVDEPGMRFTSHLKIAGRTVVFDRELEINGWSIAADQADTYMRVVAKANLNVVKLFARVRLGRIGPPNNPWRWLLASRWRRVLLAVILFILYEVIVNGLRKR